MHAQKSRIIIDTNLWVSFLLSKDYSKLDRLLLTEDVVLIFSNELLDEFISVTTRPKFKKYFNASDVRELLLKLHSVAVFADIVTEATECRDPKDNFLLSLAKDGNATHLITGDKDLLVLKKYGKTKITTLTEYLNHS
jgi:hypothetical protein